MVKVAVDDKLSLEKQSLLKLALNLACELSGSDGGSIMTVVGENLFMSAYKSSDPSVDSAGKIGITLKIGERVAGRCAQTGEPIIIVGDISKDSRFGALKKFHEIKSGASVPMKKGAQVVGVININRLMSAAPMSQDDVDVISIVGKNLAELI